MYDHGLGHIVPRDAENVQLLADILEELIPTIEDASQLGNWNQPEDYNQAEDTEDWGQDKDWDQDEDYGQAEDYNQSEDTEDWDQNEDYAQPEDCNQAEDTEDWHQVEGYDQDEGYGQDEGYNQAEDSEAWHQAENWDQVEDCNELEGMVHPDGWEQTVDENQTEVGGQTEDVMSQIDSRINTSELNEGSSQIGEWREPEALSDSEEEWDEFEDWYQVVEWDETGFGVHLHIYQA